MAWHAQTQQGVISRTWRRAHRVQQHRNQGSPADELLGIAHVNALEYANVFSDVRVILTDGTVSQNGEATTMGCGSQGQVFGKHPAETAGSSTDIAPNATGSEIDTAGGDGNAFEQPAH